MSADDKDHTRPSFSSVPSSVAPSPGGPLVGGLILPRVGPLAMVLFVGLLCLAVGFGMGSSQKASGGNSGGLPQRGSSRGGAPMNKAMAAAPMMMMADAAAPAFAGAMEGASADVASVGGMAFAAPPAPMPQPPSSAFNDAVAGLLRPAPAGDGGGGAAPAAPMIIRDGSLTANVPSVALAIDAVSALLSALGSAEALVESANQHEEASLKEALNAARRRRGEAREHEGPTSAHLSLRVPSAHFGAFSRDLRGAVARLGGSVAFESSASRDVTASFLDVTARLGVLTQSREAMAALLAAATDVRAVLEVKREMDRLTGDIEGARAQADYLSSRSAMSALSVSLQTPWPSRAELGEDDPPPEEAWSPGGALADAWASLRVVGVALATAAIYGAVYLLPLAALALFAWATGCAKVLMRR